MAINQIQIEKIIDRVAKRFYREGINPTLTQVLSEVSSFFAKYPIGNPLPLDTSGIISNFPSDVDEINTLLTHLIFNLSVLYDECILQSQQLMFLNTMLMTDIKMISAKQSRLSSQVDDYMLSLYNTDGYFYTISDSFADTSLTDLTLTSAFVDTTNNEVALPTLASASTIIPSININQPTINIVSNNNTTLNYLTISPFTFGTNGSTNTVWEIQIPVSTPLSSLTATITIPFTQPQQLSRIDVDPYATTPFQMYASVGTPDPSTGSITYSTFGGQITDTLSRSSFISSTVVASTVQLTFIKTQYDFKTVQSDGSVQYTYIFGAKDIIFTEQLYDSSASFISDSLSLANDVSNDMVIDAISVVTNDVIIPNTNINYYVANDPMVSATPNIGDFNWQAITPATSASTSNNQFVNFNGSTAQQVYIRSNPGPNDIQLIPLNSTASDPTQLNPNPLIIPETNVYMLANFTDTFLPNSINLTEGINTTRIYWTPYQVSAFNDLTYWGNIINNNVAPTPTISYARIDTGNGFFFGGTIGLNGVSVWVETYVNIDTSISPIVDTITKADPNSQTWSLNVYLNGAEIASLPGANTDNPASPVNSLLTSWAFQQGLNHIGVSINIPPPGSTPGIINPYLGVLQLFQTNSLPNIGQVELANWSYVSFFDLQYNQPGTPTSFAIYNGQIISKKQPSDNFLLTYNQSTNLGPSAIRFRADLSRSVNDPTITPLLRGYRVRFSYTNTY